MLDKSICHFSGVRSILPLLLNDGNTVDPDKTPHYVAYDLGLHCLSMTLLQISR